MGMTDLQFKSFLKRLIRTLEEAEAKETKVPLQVVKARSLAGRHHVRVLVLAGGDEGHVHEGAVLAIYCCGKVFKYLLDNGGLEAMHQRNVEKAKILYDFLNF